MTDQRLASPVLRDVGRQPVLNAVPLGSARRQVGDCYCQAGLFGEALKFALPQLYPHAVGPAAIGGNGQAVRVRVARPSQLLPPATDAFHREGGSISINSDTDPAELAAMS